MPVENLKEFNAKLTRAAVSLTEVQLVLFQKKIALDILRGVTEKTPVDKGRARANWQLTINTIPSGEVSFSATSSSGDEQFNLNVQELQKLKPFSVVWISNNVNYITYLENGSSQQAPQGMVAVTLQEMASIF